MKYVLDWELVRLILRRAAWVHVQHHLRSDSDYYLVVSNRFPAGEILWRAERRWDDLLVHLLSCYCDCASTSFLAYTGKERRDPTAKAQDWRCYQILCSKACEARLSRLSITGMICQLTNCWISELKRVEIQNLLVITLVIEQVL